MFSVSGSGQYQEWRLAASSLILYALAFNLIFFLQEVSLVIPKALTPGLYPTLFHNNQTWIGENPVQHLLQGTGALTIFVAGIVFAFLLRRWSLRSTTVQLFLFWLAFQGFFQSLPQVVIGAINPSNDVGTAMTYLHFDRDAKIAASFLACLAMIIVALWLGPRLMILSPTSSKLYTPGKRAQFLLLNATIPAFAALLLIIPFRIPRNLLELILYPLIVTSVGSTCLLVSACRTPMSHGSPAQGPPSLVYPFTALVLLLLFFQLILRRGIRFY
jgi:hypothetical protein